MLTIAGGIILAIILLGLLLGLAGRAWEKLDG
jgi:hypothetical protein